MQQLSGAVKSAFALLNKGMRERNSLLKIKQSLDQGVVKKSELLSNKKRQMLKKSVVNLRRERPKMEDSIRKFNVMMRQVMHVASDIEELETFLLAASEQTLPLERVDVFHLKSFFGEACMSAARIEKHWGVETGTEEPDLETGNGEEETEVESSSSSSSTDGDSDSEPYPESDVPEFSGDGGVGDSLW